MAALNDLLEEVEARKCARSPEYFLKKHCSIRHPARGRIPFDLRDAQKETLKAVQTHDRVVVLKARQVGFSTLFANYVLWLCLFKPDQLIIMLSRTEREAQDLLSKSKYAYELLPEWLKNRCPKVKSDTMLKIAFDNGSTVESLPSRDSPARGRSVSLVIVDEWAFLENPEDAWASIEPVTDIGGKIIGLSTANGHGNFFQTLWSGARNNTNGFFPVFFPHNAVPERNDTWYESKRSSMLDWQLHQEYPRSEDEAFIKSGNPVFDVEALLRIITVPPKTGFLWSSNRNSQEFRPSVDGELSIWAMPDPRARYVIGADVAEGLERGDYSSAHVIDIRSNLVVAHWHGHSEPDQFGLELDTLGRFYNDALLGVEVNNHGLTTLTELKRQSYPAIYYRYSLDDRTMKRTSKLGWRTSRTSKPLMIDELGQGFRQGEVDLKCEYTIAELRTFVRNAKGLMAGSPHDDRVISLAIAHQMRKHATAPDYQTPVTDYWTFDWWVRQSKDTNAPQPIGSHSVREVGQTGI